MRIDSATTKADADGMLQLEIDLNVLNHLGIGLYSNTPAVLTEIIANAWDADATMVDIVIDASGDEIVIRDNGDGMDYVDLQNKFLRVGYARREHGEAITGMGRQCMGRKGIGKLAMFSLANDIHVVSRKLDNDPLGFVIDVGELKTQISLNRAYAPVKIDDLSSYQIGPKGTTIVLRGLNKQINRTEGYLRRRLARRFSVIGERFDFRININGTPVSIGDRGFYGDIQLLWTFGDVEDEIKALCISHKKHRNFDGTTPVGGHRIRGFIGGVFKPEQLKKNDDNNNTITIMANGRIFEEDIQKKIDDSRVFNSYLVGELHADFFDKNDEIDMAVSSRQGVQENDPRYLEFVGYVKARLSEIAQQWDEWRRELGAQDVVDEFPKVQEWIESLKPHHQPKAKRLVSVINTMRFKGDTLEQKEQKKEVLRYQILAFEKLKVRDNIDRIESLDAKLNLDQFNEVIVSIDDIEATMIRDIVEQRLAVINKLQDHSNDKVRERVVQEHIYNHLWLVDPSWEHKEGSTDFEMTLTDHLKAAVPDTDEGARLDIGYRTTYGRYVVIELKKPGLSVSMDKLIAQGRKYLVALRSYFHDNPGSCPSHGETPIIDLVFLVDKHPAVTRFTQDLYDSDLKSINGKITTYTDLINQAKRSYEEHLQALRAVNRLREIVESL